MAMEKFHFTTGSGEKITLPFIEDKFKAGFLRKNRHLGEDELAWKMIEAAADEEQLERIDELNFTEFGEFMVAWREGRGATLGESKE